LTGSREPASTQAAVDQFITALKQLRRVRAEVKGEATSARFEFNVPPGLMTSA
jgi:hypothetical protein